MMLAGYLVAVVVGLIVVASYPMRPAPENHSGSHSKRLF
jgi:hypothetical protein